MGGHALWGHLGGSDSLVLTLAHHPDDDASIAVLVNTRGANLGALYLEGQVAEIVLGLDPTLQDLPVDRALALGFSQYYNGFFDGYYRRVDN